MKTKTKSINIRGKIKEIAKAALINPTDEFCQQAEAELEKTITPEFLEKVRADIIRKPKASPNPVTTKEPPVENKKTV